MPKQQRESEHLIKWRNVPSVRHRMKRKQHKKKPRTLKKQTHDGKHAKNRETEKTGKE